MTFTQLDAAMAHHMAHAAMACADPLTDSLLAQLDEAAAEEGAAMAVPYAAGLTPQQRTALAESGTDPALRWLLPLGVAA